MEALVLRLYKTDIFNNIAGFIESTTSNLPGSGQTFPIICTQGAIIRGRIIGGCFTLKERGLIIGGGLISEGGIFGILQSDLGL